MDILQFLAPGYNLKSFFKGFGGSQQKGFFPYDYFTSAEQLDETTLPPYETFYLTIKNCNVLEEGARSEFWGWQAVSLVFKPPSLPPPNIFGNFRYELSHPLPVFQKY